MKTFNALQMIILLMISPILLMLCKEATWPYHQAVFVIGVIATLLLTVFNIVLVRAGMDKL